MDRLGFAIYRLLGLLLGALPIEVVFRLGAALGGLGYYFAAPYRRLVLRNLQIAFGREKSPGELRTLARQHFAMLGANVFSSLKLPRMSREELQRVVKVEGLEVLQAGARDGIGFVMVLSHLGSWEMFAQLSPIVFPCKVGTIFQALGNGYIDAEVRRDRARLGLELFERKEGFVKACKFMREGGAVGVLADQHAGDAGLWCPFFDRLASTSTLAATLAMRTGAWLVPAAVHTDGVARWRCVIRPPIPPQGEDADTITTRINRVIEDQIRRQPFDWFWVHNRWKTPKPEFLLTSYKRGVLVPAGVHLQRFRIVIRASNWLGDAVMSAPAVQAIKDGRSDGHVAILTPAKLADFWKTVSAVDEVITIDSTENVFAVARKLRAGNFDAAVLFPNSLRTALEVWLAGIPRRVGLPGHQRRWLLDQPFVEKKKKQAAPPKHHVHQYLALAKFIGAELAGVLVDGDRVNGRRRDAPLTARSPRIGLCAGAEYGPAKRWLPERFAEVMKIVSERTQCEWKLFGVGKDREVGDAILAASGLATTDLIGKTTLAELMDQLQTCDLLLTNDTGTMHLAAFLGVPTVALFGSTEPALTGPTGARHRVIRHHVSCSPCFLRECPIDFRCMKAIEVEEVVRAVQDGLGP
ncbi:MAG: heptosyltransferase [Chthoniobacter sp.]|nr:heptosyltransferase [Chthoniobacter sp.]